MRCEVAYDCKDGYAMPCGLKMIDSVRSECWPLVGVMVVELERAEVERTERRDVGVGRGLGR